MLYLKLNRFIFMNNLNGKLLTAFLILGIIFFSLFVSVIFKEEWMSENSNVSLSNIRILKNDFVDHKIVDSVTGNNRSEQYYASRIENTNSFVFTCLEDSLVYAKSTYFNIKTLEVPETLNFPDKSIIPSAILKSNFKLQILDKNKSIIEFNAVNLYNSLNLKDKTDNLSEQRQIKLESTDKKITLYLIFNLNITIN